MALDEIQSQPVSDTVVATKANCVPENREEDAGKFDASLIDAAVEGARNAFDAGRTHDVPFRKRQLQQFDRMLCENSARIRQAFDADMRKTDAESHMEMLTAISHVRYLTDNVAAWAAPEHPPKRLCELMYDCRIYNDPLGVVLVMGSWNVPLLTLLPIAGAIAAGNCVISKPSHNCPHFSALIQQLMAQYLDPICYPVLVGGIPATQYLLSQHRFDYIYYTGSVEVGRIIHGHATAHLTPTTLELGGKNPLYLDDSVDVQMAARRIMWGKCMMAGQTCIAPDYVMCNSRDLSERFVSACADTICAFFGPQPQQSAHLARIVNAHHFARLRQLLRDCHIAVGGSHDERDLYIEPTIVTDVPEDHDLMRHEIFGPILVVQTVQDEMDAIRMVKRVSAGKPLALYVFSERSAIQRRFLEETSSGSVAINDTMLHLVVESLPFGGVGQSGMGRYKAKYSFDTFVHKKSVLKNSTNCLWENVQNLRYPPIRQRDINLATFLIKYRRSEYWMWQFFRALRWILVLGVGIAIGVAGIILYQRHLL